jgi:hypothetical protein
MWNVRPALVLLARRPSDAYVTLFDGPVTPVTLGGSVKNEYIAWALLAGTLLFSACKSDDGLVGPLSRQATFNHQFYDEVPGEGGVVCHAMVAGSAHEYTDGSAGAGPLCETAIGVAPPSEFSAMSVGPGSYDPIHVAFSRPVSHLVISNYAGIVHCGDDFGSITAHRISGEEVTVALEPYLQPPSSGCGYEWWSGTVYHLQDFVNVLMATIPDGAPVDRIVITAPGGSRVWDECATDYAYDPPRTDCSQVETVVGYLVLFREFDTNLNAGIDLACAGSGAPRGGTVSCQATPQVPTDPLVVTGWTFTSDANDVVPREGAGVSDPNWAGQLVVNGQIVVTGTVGGQAATGTASVTATARDWSAKTVRSTHTTPGADGLPIRPTALEAQLGLSTLSMGIRQDPENYLGFITDDGPNNRFAYTTDIPFETFTIARVNYPVMTQGSDWYLIQETRDMKIGGISYCGRDRVLTLPPLVEAHEGTDPANQPNSHVGIYINDVTRDARVSSEQLAGLASKLNLEPTMTAIHNAAVADASAMDHDSRNNMNSSTLPCVFHYFTP